MDVVIAKERNPKQTTTSIVLSCVGILIYVRELFLTSGERFSTTNLNIIRHRGAELTVIVKAAFRWMFILAFSYCT